MRALVEVFRATTTVKVLHAGSEDMEVFARLGLPPPMPLFDTQLAAGFAGVGYSMGYTRLVAELLGVELAGDQSRSDWLRRPLSPAQFHYAAEDVAHLPALHQMLSTRLAMLGRDQWLAEECARMAATAACPPDPQSAWRRVRAGKNLQGRAHAALRALAAWRDREAARRDRPRNRVLKEEVLLAICERLPDSIAGLRQVPGMPADELQRSGERLCHLIAHASEGPEDAVSALASRNAADLLRKMKRPVREQATSLQMPPELLMPNRLLEALLVAFAPGGNQELPTELAGWRKPLIVDSVLRVLKEQR